jgi:hypothetical protein
MGPVTVLSSDSHVFEPPDLWTKRIDAAFRDRAPRMERVDGADEIVVAQGQVLSGIGLLSNTGVRFEAPEIVSVRARFEDVPRGGYDPDQHLRDMRLDGVAGEVLYPSQGLFYFRVADPALMSAIFRAYKTIISTFETLPSKDIETLPVPVELTGGYCWRTPFKVLGVLFLGKVFPAFLPSKKACGTHKFRHF